MTSAQQKLPQRIAGKKLVLHVGCGDNVRGSRLHAVFKTPEWQEVRLDIDPSVKPDIIADMTNLSMIPDRSVDAIWSSHNIEHVFAHEVPIVLKEFQRVLAWNGVLMMATPDLYSVCDAVVKKGLEQPLYQSPAGPISAIDIIYGFRKAVSQGSVFMAHKTGFTTKTIATKLKEAGFYRISIVRDTSYNLSCSGIKLEKPEPKDEKLTFREPDINLIIKERDKLEVEPTDFKPIVFAAKP